jgi:hypothetical protein
LEPILKKAILPFLLFGAVIAASPVNVTWLNAGNGTPDSTGQYYVGPYTLSINGTATAAMCVNDNLTNNGDVWRANLTAANSTDFSDTHLGNSGQTINGVFYSSAQVYNAEAYLFSLITQPGADQADIQEAAWFIMDPSNPAYGSISRVHSYFLAAVNNSSQFDSGAFSIVSDTTGEGHQEFIVSASATTTPEPASAAFLGCGLLAAGVARIRRGKWCNR